MKLRNRALIKILTALILIAVILSIPLTAYAGDSDNGSDNESSYSGDGGQTNGKGGASYQYSGYLAYIVDKNGNLKSDVAFLYWSSNPLPSGYNTTYMRSAFGSKQFDHKYVIDSSYPHPYTYHSSGNVGNGEELAEKLAKYIDGTDVSYAAQLIGEVWGDDDGIATLYNKGGYYLILEAVWWIRLDSFKGPLDGKSYCATSKGWAALLQANGYDPNTYGNLSGSQYRALTNLIYPICMTFRQSMLGLDPACAENLSTGVVNTGSRGYYPNSYILSDVAAGMIVVWKDGDTQTTNDETLSVEHSAPDESTGTYQIVKSYVDKLENADGSVTYTDAGTYVKTDSAAEISIEDESSNTGYSLLEWRATDSSDTSVTSVSNNSLVWDSNVPVVSSPKIGTSGEYTIDLSDDTTTLYEFFYCNRTISNVK